MPEDGVDIEQPANVGEKVNPPKKNGLGTWSEISSRQRPTDPSRREFLKFLGDKLKDANLTGEEIRTTSEKIDKLPISRRDLLKGVVAGWTALSIEPVNKALRSLGLLEEGNIFRKSEDVVEHLVTLFTEQDPEKKAVAQAFLKFQAGIYYAQARGLNLSGECMEHFLYGEGKSLDITEQYLDKLKQSLTDSQSRVSRNTKISAEIDDNSLIFEHTKSIFSDEDGGSFGSFTTQDHGPFIKKDGIQIEDFQSIESHDSIEVYGVVDGSRISYDMLYSIGEYTVSLVAQIDTINSESIGIETTSLRIIDMYDWDNLNGLDAGTTLARFAYDLGIAEHLPEEWLDKMSEIYLNITDEDGQILQESGKGRPFDISAEFDLTGKRLQIPVRK